MKISKVTLNKLMIKAEGDWDFLIFLLNDYWSKGKKTK